MSREKGTIVLDARSKDKYDLLHVKGAINLPFTDIAVESVDGSGFRSTSIWDRCTVERK